MTPYILAIFIVATRIFHINSSEAVCGPNEVEKTQIDCIDDCCPGPKGQPSACPDPCASACKCAPFYLRNPNGTCVEGSQCPSFPCGKNEIFTRCPSPLCPEDCSNASPDGKRCKIVGRALFRLMCRPACRCIDNYWRNGDTCVPYNKCPQVQMICE